GQRPLPDQEAEPQVVHGEPLQMAAKRPAGLQALADAADETGALAVVADEGDVAAGLAPRGGLADVVEEGAEAQRVPAAHLIRERLVEEGSRVGRALAGVALQVGVDL